MCHSRLRIVQQECVCLYVCIEGRRYRQLEARVSVTFAQFAQSSLATTAIGHRGKIK